MFFLLCLTQCTLYKFTFDFSEILNCICAEIIFVFANWLVLIFSKTLPMLFGRYEWLCNWCIFLWNPISYLWNWWMHQTAEYSLAKTMNLGASPLAGDSSCCSPLPNFQESHTYFEQYLQWVRVSKGFKVGDVYRHGSIAKQYMIKFQAL